MRAVSPEASLARRRMPLPAALLRAASDQRLVDELRVGSERAFEILFDRHYRPLLAFCRHLLGSAAEAEDAVQHTFVAAHRDLLGSQKPIVVRPWLYTIARNRCLSLLRARRERPMDEVFETAPDNLAADFVMREDLRALLADVGRLPEEQRAALVLMELGDFSHEEIGGVLGCPREKVKSLVFQARCSLTASRAARDTPCGEIREQLATPDGGGVSRTALRRHLHACAPCRGFRDEMRTQRRELALLLPLVASPALRASVLTAVFGGGGGAGGAAVTVGALLGGDLAAKALVAAAIVGGGGVAGAAAMAPTNGTAAAAAPASAAGNEPIALGRPLSARSSAGPISRTQVERPTSGLNADPPTDHQRAGTATNPGPRDKPEPADTSGNTDAGGVEAPNESDHMDRSHKANYPEHTGGANKSDDTDQDTEFDNADDGGRSEKRDQRGQQSKPDQGAKQNKADKADHGGGQSKLDKAAKPDNGGGQSKLDKADKPDNGGGQSKPDKADKPDNGQGKPDKADNGGGQSKPENVDKPDHGGGQNTPDQTAKPAPAATAHKPDHGSEQTGQDDGPARDSTNLATEEQPAVS